MTADAPKWAQDEIRELRIKLNRAETQRAAARLDVLGAEATLKSRTMQLDIAQRRVARMGAALLRVHALTQEGLAGRWVEIPADDLLTTIDEGDEAFWLDVVGVQP